MTYDSSAHSGVVQNLMPENERNSLNEFPTRPGPVKIIVPNEEDHSFTLNEEFLERILLNPKVADKKVCLILDFEHCKFRSQLWGLLEHFGKGKAFCSIFS